MNAKPLLVAASLAVTLAAASAQAQEFIRADCRNFVTPSASLAFDGAEHRKWYRRFWTGSCHNLPVLRCVPGSPNWNDTVAQLVSRGRADQAAAITAQACPLGQAIGHEWARDKAVRRIDTNDLRSYFADLDRAPDVVTGMTRVDRRVRAALAKR
jgi:hypothetical protein